jgi:hypothetical protein
MKMVRRIYPSLVGLLLGSLQTGLYFQLSFTLSSSFRTFLMVTVCWLMGSVIGVLVAKQAHLPLNGLLALTIAMYFACAALLSVAPFNTELWPVYAIFIMVSGLYPGVFFVRLNQYYSAQTLFFRENNGFIAGTVMGTLLFLVSGRLALWIIPLLLAGMVFVCSQHLASREMVKS